MKYLISWHERPYGSPSDYEAAQKRVLEVFEPWKAPDSFAIQQFLVRVGEYGGYMVVETDDIAAIHELTSTFAVFRFRVEPVMEVMDAVAAEVEAIKYRDSLDQR